MKSDEQFEAFCSEQLIPLLSPLEKQRKQSLLTFLFVLGLCLTLGLQAAWDLVHGSMDQMYGLLLISAAVVLVSQYYQKIIKGYAKSYKSIVIKSVVQFVDPGLSYNPDSFIVKRLFTQSQLFERAPDLYMGEDHVYGHLGNTQFELSEICAEEIHAQGSGGKEYRTIFKGLFFMADFNKSFQGSTFVLPDYWEKYLPELSRTFQLGNVNSSKIVRLEDAEFEKAFKVYSNNQVEARYILTPGLMRRILDFKNKSKSQLSLAFKDSKIYLAIDLDYSLFEPSLFRSLYDRWDIDICWQEIKLALGIIEDLNLNLRIWSKE